MADSALKVWRDRDGKLLRLRLSRPKANIVDAEMIAALTKALAEASSDIHVKAVLIDHEGPHFSFGASVPEHMPDQCAAMLKGLHALIIAMVEYPVPILVSVRGQCLGGGLEVALAGHMMFVAPDAKLGQPEIILGVFAPAASCLLPERMPRVAAEDLLYSGRSITGEDALRLGIANAVADEPEAAALAWFDAGPAKHSASSLRFAVKAARLGMNERVKAKIAAVEELYLNGLMATFDAVEGLNAFVEKRAALWEDR
ncbi:cyclohexa-1,5-dienecarbonyl-CoA hydratase [Paramagnetospirillum kuznetsovii]|uniref:Cyclohexa-1,5-dienecarbonyl-CoA hydratase n=1 Tax=Paramagnetospirillum kuznetsovii TaxID=2053833 RepID=A0A364NSU0_9PROT|nr:cyclohexa-1,5-dienecarbonyl-CoA hydratase [Paramagnetospirillum kuznetsovii]RAU20138.1 cyclohexa-1,5-dienecarbonyl-CoA hydratase [Paramagnetospirillum kuznetsovii]